VTIGEAMVTTKQRYFLETPRFDAYDEKTIMEWELFGLPMYAVKTGISSALPPTPGPTRCRAQDQLRSGSGR